jgi:hypothetical protein
MSINIQKISNGKFLLIFSILFLFVSLIISYMILPWVSINRARFMGTVITFLVLFWCLFLCARSLPVRWQTVFDKNNPLYLFIESRALIILTVFILLIICWYGLDIFLNPYLYDYNHGNGAYFSQVLHNVISGIGPENTVKYDEVLFYHSNPYFYASAFAAVPQILPILLLAPLYYIHPVPPMHVFALVILVLVFGTGGIYMAARALKGSKMMALIAAIGYCMLPWVERSIFIHGHFDAISYAVYPCVFAALFARRWILFYIAVLLLALINIPYAYSVIALGVIIAFFFRVPKHGFIVIIIGILVMLWDQAIIRESLCGIWNVERQPSGTLKQILLDMDMTSFIKAVLYHVVYLFLILLSVAFIPLLGLKKNKSWNWPLIGLLLFALIGAVMGLFRSYDIASHRNANMVVPLYLSAFMVLAGMFNPEINPEERHVINNEKTMLIIFLFLSGIGSSSLWFSNHYPWAGITKNGILSQKYIQSAPVNEKYDNILNKLREFVPEDASVAYRIDAAIQAYITNRQKAWYLGYHPEGVEYYFIQTKDVVYIDKNLKPWKPYLTKVENDNNNKLLYKNDDLVIYKNLKLQPIPRLDSVLGWDVIFKALLPDKCRKIQTKS